MLLREIAARDEKADNPPPGFIFFGFQIKLFPALYEQALAIMPQYRDGYGSVARAIEKLDAEVSRLWPDGDPDPNMLARDDLARLMAIIHIAALSGLFAYPPRAHGKPGDVHAPG